MNYSPVTPSCLALSEKTSPSLALPSCLALLPCPTSPFLAPSEATSGTLSKALPKATPDNLSCDDSTPPLGHLKTPQLFTQLFTQAPF